MLCQANAESNDELENTKRGDALPQRRPADSSDYVQTSDMTSPVTWQ